MKLETKHWIGIGVGVLVLTTAGVIIYKKRQKSKDKEQKMLNASAAPPIEKENVNAPEQAGQPVVEQPPLQDVASPFPLKRGSKGYEVMVLQQYMNSTCKASLKSIENDPIAVNGVWDETMENCANVCVSVKRSEINEEMYNRIYRDLEAANILPKI